MTELGFETKEDGYWLGKNRPKRSDGYVLDNVAIEFGKTLYKWAGDGDEKGCIDDAKKLLKNSYVINYDGFELAKELEDRFFYTGDSELVEVCDDLIWIVRKEHTKHIIEWVRINDIVPVFTIGTVVSFNLSKTQRMGKISKIDLLEATYTIEHLDADGQLHNYIINYEDVSAI